MGGESLPFEGVEKKLCLDFIRAPTRSTSPSPNHHSNRTNHAENFNDAYTTVPRHPIPLTQLSSEQLTMHVLNAAQCQILNRVERDGNVAYLLSESSLLLSDCRAIIKTCGTTTPLLAVAGLVMLARDCGWELGRLFFSHFDFCFPQHQKFPHRSFEEELDYIKAALGEYGNFELSSQITKNAGVGTKGRNFYAALAVNFDLPEHTALLPFHFSEVLMLGVAENCVAAFAGDREERALPLDSILRRADVETECSDTSEAVTPEKRTPPLLTSGRSMAKDASSTSLISSSTTATANEAHTEHPFLDEFWFEPCGYSCNLLLPQNRFLDVHISPEAGSSYASFEVGSLGGVDAFYGDLLSLSELTAAFAVEEGFHIAVGIGPENNAWTVQVHQIERAPFLEKTI